MMKIVILNNRRVGTTQHDLIARYEGRYVREKTAKFVEDGLFPGHLDYRRDYVEPDDGLSAVAPNLFTPVDFDCITYESYATQADFNSLIVACTDGSVGDEIWAEVFTFMQEGETRAILMEECTSVEMPALRRDNHTPARGFKLVILLARADGVTPEAFRSHDEQRQAQNLKELMAAAAVPMPLDVRWSYIVQDNPALELAPAGFFQQDVGFDCLVELTLSNKDDAKAWVAAIQAGSLMQPGDLDRGPVRIATVESWVGYGDDPKVALIGRS